MGAGECKKHVLSVVTPKIRQFYEGSTKSSSNKWNKLSMLSSFTSCCSKLLRDCLNVL